MTPTDADATEQDRRLALYQASPQYQEMLKREKFRDDAQTVFSEWWDRLDTAEMTRPRREIAWTAWQAALGIPAGKWYTLEQLRVVLSLDDDSEASE